MILNVVGWIIVVSTYTLEDLWSNGNGINIIDELTWKIEEKKNGLIIGYNLVNIELWIIIIELWKGLTEKYFKYKVPQFFGIVRASLVYQNM